MSGPVDPRRLVESVEATERAAEELDEERELLGSEAEARAAYEASLEHALHAAPVDAEGALHRVVAPTDAEGRAAIRGRRQWPLPEAGRSDGAAPRGREPQDLLHP